MVEVVCLVPYQISVGQTWFRCLLDAIAGAGGVVPYQMSEAGSSVVQHLLLTAGWGFSAIVTLHEVTISK